jgi:transcriptional regulator with XRE-family HTH domain
MKLDDYIKQSGKTEERIAALSGCSQSTVNKVRNGVGNPTFDVLRRISKATDGAFMPGDFEPMAAKRKTTEAAE